MALYTAIHTYGLVDVPETGGRRLPSRGGVRIHRRPPRRRGRRV